MFIKKSHLSFIHNFGSYEFWIQSFPHIKGYTPPHWSVYIEGMSYASLKPRNFTEQCTPKRVDYFNLSFSPCERWNAYVQCTCPWMLLYSTWQNEDAHWVGRVCVWVRYNRCRWWNLVQRYEASLSIGIASFFEGLADGLNNFDILQRYLENWKWLMLVKIFQNFLASINL